MELTATQQNILNSAKRWFLEKSFKSAPLRKIVSDAGFTLGAFYGYYKNKEELFYALTDETAQGVAAIVRSIGEDMKKLPPEQMLFSMLDCYLRRLPELADYLCTHREEMVLLLRCSGGTKYENFFDSFRITNMERISQGVKTAERTAKALRGIDPGSLDLMMRGYFDMLAHIILETEDKETIIRRMRDVALVYRNGMLSLMEEETDYA